MFRTIKRRIFHPAILVCILLGVATGLSVNVRADGEMVIEAGWSCPNPTVSNGGCSCSASGCKKASAQGDWVCDYAASGQGCSCPPLNMCDP